jgi:hypothetical protein
LRIARDAACASCTVMEVGTTTHACARKARMRLAAAGNNDVNYKGSLPSRSTLGKRSLFRLFGIVLTRVNYIHICFWYRVRQVNLPIWPTWHEIVHNYLSSPGVYVIILYFNASWMPTVTSYWSFRRRSIPGVGNR